jgi:hypothetical protein
MIEGFIVMTVYQSFVHGRYWLRLELKLYFRKKGNFCVQACSKLRRCSEPDLGCCA